MADSIFPESVVQRLREPAARVRLLRREPLAPLRETLRLSLDDTINDPARRFVLLELFRISRSIEDEQWLRRQLEML